MGGREGEARARGARGVTGAILVDGGRALITGCSPLWGAGGQGCLVNTLFSNAFFLLFFAVFVFFPTFVAALNLIFYVGISHSESGEIGKRHTWLFVRERATPLPYTRTP